jgi:peptidyl-prolyl cis-trans isomerase D
MLEQLRRSSQSLLIYVLFGIVIAVFIINFGPQSQGGCESSVARSTYAAKVGSGTVTTRDFRYAYILAGGPQYQPQKARELRLRERILDELVERELLVAEAERLGFAVSDEEVEDLIADSKLIGLGGYEQPATAMQKDGHFDYATFVRFVQFQLNMTPKVFIDEQKRELLATRVRNLLRNGVNVSEHEVKSEFDRQSNQVNLEFVRFSWRRHEDAVELTPAEIQAYAKANEKKLKDLYEQRKFLYENAPKERRLRQILVKLDSGASAEATTAAEKKAQALHDRIKKGETFAAVARSASDDTRSKLRGGDVGWRRQGATPFGAALEEKVWAAKDGEVVGPMKGNDGFYLVLPEATREGNISFAQVGPDLAETELRQERAKAKAKAEADAALAKVKAPAAKDKTLKDLFPAPPETLQGAEVGPRAEETGLFARRGTVVEGIGIAPELAKGAFELKETDPFGGPYEVAGSYVIVKMKERKQPDQAEFDKKKGEFMHQAALARGEQILAEWTQRRCLEAKEAKRIRVNPDILRYEDTPANERIAYEPCAPPFRF